MVFQSCPIYTERRQILIDLSVQGGVVGDGGAKICELFNDIELIVIDGDGWQFRCILPQDVGLLETDG